MSSTASYRPLISYVLILMHYHRTSWTTYVTYNLSYQLYSTIVSHIAAADLTSPLSLCPWHLAIHRSWITDFHQNFLSSSTISALILLLEIAFGCRWWSLAVGNFLVPLAQGNSYGFFTNTLRFCIFHVEIYDIWFLYILLVAHMWKESNTSSHAGPVDALETHIIMTTMTATS